MKVLAIVTIVDVDTDYDLFRLWNERSECGNAVCGEQLRVLDHCGIAVLLSVITSLIFVKFKMFK